MAQQPNSCSSTSYLWLNQILCDLIFPPLENCLSLKCLVVPFSQVPLPCLPVQDILSFPYMWKKEGRRSPPDVVLTAGNTITYWLDVTIPKPNLGYVCTH